MSESLATRGPAALAGLMRYLEAAGWHHDQGSRTSVWTPPGDHNQDLQATLPLDSAVSDLTTYLEEAARVVSFAEGITVAELWTGVLDGGADRLSLRLTPQASSGTAPLALAQESFTALRRLLIGSTAALSTDALVLPSRRPAAVESYAAEARVTTRPGSFIIDVALPLTVAAPVQNGLEGQETLIDVPPLPLGRRVSRRVTTVASNALAMAERVLVGDADISQFSNPTLRLGNALELDALSRLGGDDSGDYQLRVTQSALAPGTARPKRLRATKAQREQLGGAAEYLRSTQAQLGVDIEGIVVRLSRESQFGAGDVTIRAELDDSGKTKSCLMSLAEDDYNSAVRAHQEGLIVLVKGDLVTAGNNRKRLRNPSQFQVVHVI